MNFNHPILATLVLAVSNVRAFGPATVAIASLLLPLESGAVHLSPQTGPEAQQARLVFEVAAVKESPSALEASIQILPGGALRASAVPLRRIVMTAYGLNQRYLVVDGPEWIDATRFDIEARSGAGSSNITPAQVRLMLRSLLEDRFKLRAHTEMRQLPVYELTIARRGLKLTAPKDGSCVTLGAPAPLPPLPPPSFPGQPAQRTAPMTPPCGVASVAIGPGGGRIDGGKLTIESFLRTLQSLLGRPIIDKTGFTGTFDAHVEFTPDEALSGLPAGGPAPRSDLGVSIFTAMEEELGLKLDSARGPVEVLIIDSAEKPTQN